MRLGTQELMEMHEVLNESVCMIEHYAMYLNHGQDPELRRILERQQRHMIDSYNAKVNLSQSQGIDITGIPRPAMGARTAGITMEGRPEHGMQHVPPAVNSPDATSLNDRAIATGAMVFHKCGAVRSTNAAFVCTDPQLRNFLSTAAKSCVEMAYEMFQYMNQKGWYPARMMQQHTMTQTQQTYQTQAGH
ncbi:MAG: spore coat protein [Desulfotomaculaceae bacterium]